MRSIRLVLGAAGLLAAAALTGCTSSPVGAVVTPGPSTSASATATSEPTPTETVPVVTSTPVAVTCDDLISAQELYDINPNFGTLPSYAPEAGSDAAKAVADQGIACAWSNQTSNEVIEISVAHLSSDEITAMKNALIASSNPVPTYGTEAYFQMDGQVGDAQIFKDDYWIVARSVTFFEPGDAGKYVDDVLGAL